jgi:hypothetical protein
MEIHYDKPIEVSKEKYQKLIAKLPQMVIAHRQENGRYFIKLWAMSFKKQVEKIIKS